MAFSPAVQTFYQHELAAIRRDGLYKEERKIGSPQGAEIEVEFPPGAPRRRVLNFCANNYLGLASHPAVVAAAREGLDTRGYGLASVRFICGTQDLHLTLEQSISRFLGTDDTILYTSCFNANVGLFETLLPDSDCAVISDELNHASIIDGIRLCKAERLRYKHADVEDLEDCLKKTRHKRVRLVTTDGVFSMDGDIARLGEICDLAEHYDALVMVDDSHATGFMGATGRGTIEYCGVMGRVDLVTSTLGKALGGALGGFTSGRAVLIEYLRQRSRPYIFSNTVPPVVIRATQAAFDIIAASTDLRDRLEENTLYFRRGLTEAGLDVKAGIHPIVPVMLYNARLAQDVARDLYGEGIYVIGFFFPVVARGRARIRVQISAAHERAHLDQAIEAFRKVGEKYGILGLHRSQVIERYGE